MSYLVDVPSCWLIAPEGRDMKKDCDSLKRLRPVPYKHCISRTLGTPDDGNVNWSKDEIEADLLKLQGWGYRGAIEFFDSIEYEGTKYTLTDDGVEMRNASIEYPELADEMVTDKEGGE